MSSRPSAEGSGHRILGGRKNKGYPLLRPRCKVNTRDSLNTLPPKPYFEKADPETSCMSTRPGFGSMKASLYVQPGVFAYEYPLSAPSNAAGSTGSKVGGEHIYEILRSIRLSPKSII